MEHASACGVQDPETELSFLSVVWLSGSSGGWEAGRHIAVGCSKWRALRGVSPVILVDAEAGSVVWSTAAPAATAQQQEVLPATGHREDACALQAGCGGPRLRA